MALPLAKAELIGALSEALCYGMYFVVSLELFRLVYVRLQAGRRTLYLFVTAVVIFSLITIHLILQINRIIEGFTDYMDVANAPVTYFNSISVRSRTVKTSIYMSMTLVCDALFVYRVFVVYGREYVSIMIPLMLFLADIALSAWSTWSISQVNPGLEAVRGANKRFEYFYAITLMLNLLCTVMISWKIWAIHRNVSEPAVAGVRFMGVVSVIVESAAVYSCVLISLMVTSTIRTNGLWVILDSTCPIVGMVFSAMMVRASREYHTDTFATGDFAVPMYRPTDRIMSSERQVLKTVPRNAAGDIVTGHNP